MRRMFRATVQWIRTCCNLMRGSVTCAPSTFTMVSPTAQSFFTESNHDLIASSKLGLAMRISALMRRRRSHAHCGFSLHAQRVGTRMNHCTQEGNTSTSHLMVDMHRSRAAYSMSDGMSPALRMSASTASAFHLCGRPQVSATYDVNNAIRAGRTLSMSCTSQYAVSAGVNVRSRGVNPFSRISRT